MLEIIVHLGEFTKQATKLVSATAQILALFVICIGMAKAVKIFIKDALFGQESAIAIHESRMELGHAFSLGLGFLIGASILKTTATPEWDLIGKLTAIIAIRTILNLLLSKELKDDLIKSGENKNNNNNNKEEE